MRKALFPMIVVISLLSAMGMGYFHYYRVDCKVTPTTVQVLPGSGGTTITTTYSNARVENRKCYVTATSTWEGGKLKPVTYDETLVWKEKMWVKEFPNGVDPNPARH